jgi:sugar phosphate isomerase/epimerase
MKLSVMTLGCPTWDLDTVLARAKEYGYQGVDFRGLAGEMDITKLPLFTTDIAATRRKIAAAGLEVSGISSSIRVCDPGNRQGNIEEAKRTIPVALELGARNIRIFGGGKPDVAGNIDKAEAAKLGRDVIEEILALPGADKLSWNFETHDFWIKSTDCTLLLNTITHPAFGALWDIGHTSRVGGETPEQTYAAIGPRVRYTHFKDATMDKSHPDAMKKGVDEGWRYVLPGTGQLPLEEGLQLLIKNEYTGWFMFEHEKKWHPTLPEPEVAFPAFIHWIRSLKL